MRVYFDRPLSPRLARAAKEVIEHLGHGCDWSRNRYPERDPGDVIWLRELAAEGGWTVVTGDERIARNPGELAVWRSSGLTTFFLQSSWMAQPMEAQAWRLLRWVPRMVGAAAEERPGTGLSIPPKWHGGKLQRVFTPSRP